MTFTEYKETDDAKKITERCKYLDRHMKDKEVNKILFSYYTQLSA